MTQARSRLVSVSDTPYYHCISRCVRRAFLCGNDPYSGQSFDHRRDWFIERLALLTEVFDIEVCAYAVMSNHCHLVVNIVGENVKALPINAVIDRWCRLYRGPEVVQRYRRGDVLTPAEQEDALVTVEGWRARLSDLSWFMRCLNEHIARRANAEDNCTGRFWEGRFKSQALLDETALITAMCYVDLNPIRAGLSSSLVGSEKTSVKQRIEAVTQPTSHGPAIALMPFSGAPNHSRAELPFNLQDYLNLLDTTGRCIRSDNHYGLDAAMPRLLQLLGIAPNEWLPTVSEMQARFESVMGAPGRMRAHATARGGCFYRGYRNARRFYLQMAA